VSSAVPHRVRRWVVARTTTAAVACLLPGVALAAGAAAGLDQLMASMRAHPHRHGTFIEHYRTKILDRPVEATGELFYDAPDRVEKRTLKPRPERLVLDHGTLTVERRHRTYQTTLAAYPRAAPYIDSIRAPLAGDRAALERVFRVEYSAAGDGWTLVLTPRAKTDVEDIRIDGSLDQVRTVTINLASGDRSVMTLTDAPAR
jgi:hypothetical protein